MRTLVLLLCLLLALPGAAPAAESAKKVRAARAARAKSAAKTANAAEPTLSAEELQNPYSAGLGDNATNWRFDPQPQGLPFGKATDSMKGKAAEDEFLRLRVGREEVIDPLTRKDLVPKADPQKAGDSLKNMNLKDAMDKSGGKAEVQVNILKF